MTIKSVAIIGAGASGLVSAKVLSDDGFDITVFERGNSLGGTWSENMAYLQLHTQQPGGTMEFADLPDGTEYGSWQHTHEYLSRYADSFHLRERIRFNSRVISIEKDELENINIPWTVTVETCNGLIEIHKFHFLIIATGLQSEPYVIRIPGQEKFSGSIVHPSTVKTEDQLYDKRVAIIGCGKSATDMATMAATYARSCHIIFRRAHWSLPYVIMGGRLSAKYILTRAICCGFSPFPGAPHTRLFRFLHKYFSGIFTKMTDATTNDIIAINGPDLYGDKIFLPLTSFRNAENVSMIPKNFIRLKREGRIVGKLANIDKILDQTTLQLDTGEHLSIDLIISASGYNLTFPFFSDRLTEALGLRPNSEDITTSDEIDLNLYRRIVPVGIPNIAFSGFFSTIGQWMLTEVGSHWISDYFLGRLKLPSSNKEMYDEIQKTRNFIRTTYNRDISSLVHHWVAPIDTLLQDMGVDMHRKNNWLTEYFSVYQPERFKTLHLERQRKAEGRSIHRFYFSFKHTIFLMIAFLVVFYAILLR